MRFIPPLILMLLTHSLFSQPLFDIEGHRGCRGLYPENTMAAFMAALRLGVNTLEMDVVISKDGKVVVSHDPYINPAFCQFPEEQPSDLTAQKTARLYDKTYAEIARYDCGSMVYNRFPEQKKMFTSKPLLSDVIDSVEKYIAENNLPPVQYNIETKSTPEGDDIDQPKPPVFVKLLYHLLKQKNVLTKTIIQSFDVRTLQVLHKTDSTVATALLIADLHNFNKNIRQLGFTPTIYSPNYLLVNKKLLRQCRAQKVKLIPWTVNDAGNMLHLKKMGVDGLITDYPDRAIKALRP